MTVTPKKKRRAGIWIGLALILAGIVLGIALVAGGISSATDTVKGYQRVPMAGGGSISITEPGTYRIFMEFDGASEGSQAAPRVFVTVQGPNGPVAVLPDSTGESYSMAGHEGRKLGKFEASSPGSYQIRPISRDGNADFGEIAIGKKGPLGSAAAIAAGVLGGLALAGIGIVVIIVSAVRSGRRATPMAPPPGYGGGWGAAPYPAGGPGAPVPGWGAPGWSPPPPGVGGPASGPPGWVPPPTVPPAAPPPPAGPQWVAPAPPPPTTPTSDQQWGTTPPWQEPDR